MSPSTSSEENIKLTDFSRGAGCGCKISPEILDKILEAGLVSSDENLLVGNSNKDDAAVWDLGNGQALLSTTDFFMPVVNDALDFGKIAAANAISDIYAMGAKPVMALAILGWPIDKLAPALAQKVMEGARLVAKAAGIALAGGHSIDSAEPFFGLTVNGICDVAHIKRNDTAREGDILYLTKPLGTGILSTALKRKVLPESQYQDLVHSMTFLNKAGEALGKLSAVTAMTDVTGFGLAGHLIEMAEGANLSAELEYTDIPFLPGVKECLSQRIIPDATYRNWNSFGQKVELSKDINVMEAFSTLPDPQTNGGLLVAVNPAYEEEVQKLLNPSVHPFPVVRIGRFISRKDKVLYIK